MASVACGGCGEALDEPSDLDAARRKPCPACGSISRSFGVELHGTVETHSSLSAKAKHAGATGKHKWFIEAFSGADWSHQLLRFVRKQRTIDRDNDRYVERVVDPLTDEVLHDVEEPLSEHWGHGSARRRSIDRQKGPRDV